jgi:thioredoxin 1
MPNDSGKLMLLDFKAPWCGPCRSMQPIVEKVLSEFENVELIEINVDEDTDLARQYQVRYLPTFILIKDGEVVDRIMGATTAENLKKFISQ